MILWRSILRTGLGLCAFIAGCGGCRPEPCAGVPPRYFLPHDSSVTLNDVDYAPATSVRAGDTLTFTVTANKTIDTDAGYVIARLGTDARPVAGSSTGTLGKVVYDDGFAPDAMAGDGVFTGDRQIPDTVEPQQDIPVIAEVIWEDGFPGPSIQGEPLDIEEPPAE